MLTDIVLFIIGLALIITGGNLFVDSAVWASEKLRVPKFIIGATIVSLATTLPELIVSVIATVGGKYEMAAGNAIGSVVVNTGFILAVTVIAMPFKPQKSGLLIKSALLIGAAGITFLFSLSGKFGYVPAIILLSIWLAFMVLNLVEGKRAEDVAPSLHTPVSYGEIALKLLAFGLGVGGLIAGSDLLVDRGSAIAASVGVPESVIAVTIVALGTSLPELVTAVTALIKKQSSLSVGNIIGANIMDIAFIMPICALVSGGLVVKPQTLWFDLPACIILTLVVFTLPSEKKFIRLSGVVLLILYAVYLSVLLNVFG